MSDPWGLSSPHTCCTLEENQKGITAKCSCFIKMLTTSYGLLAGISVSYCTHAFIIKQKLQINYGFLYKIYFLPHPKCKLRQHNHKSSEWSNWEWTENTISQWGKARRQPVQWLVLDAILEGFFESTAPAKPDQNWEYLTSMKFNLHQQNKGNKLYRNSSCRVEQEKRLLLQTVTCAAWWMNVCIFNKSDIMICEEYNF